jgi:hypothetical protein
MQKFGKNGISSLLFQLIEITDRVLFFDSATPRDKTCFIEHAFCQRCFAGTGMTEQNYIFDVGGVKISHGKTYFP